MGKDIHSLNYFDKIMQNKQISKIILIFDIFRSLNQVVERFSTTPNARWYSSPENQKQVYFVMNPVDR